jgi:hypothetical protein
LSSGREGQKRWAFLFFYQFLLFYIFESSRIVIPILLSLAFFKMPLVLRCFFVTIQQLQYRYTVLLIRIHFFRIRIHNFVFAFGYGCFHMCSGICTTEKKVFQLKNLGVFSLSSVWSAIFHKNFYFTIVSGSESKSELFRIRIQPKYSDSFGFGSTTLPVFSINLFSTCVS